MLTYKSLVISFKENGQDKKFLIQPPRPFSDTSEAFALVYLLQHYEGKHSFEVDMLAKDPEPLRAQASQIGLTDISWEVR